MTVGNYQESLFGGRMFAQGLFEESSVQKHPIGFMRPLEDGRKFVYTKNAAVALAAGVLLQAAAPVAHYLGMTTAAAAIGAKRVSVTPGATDAVADYYREGFLHVNTSTGVGHSYKVRGHKAITGAAAAYIELYDAIRATIDATSKTVLTKALADSVIIFPTTQTAPPAGVSPFVITLSYFFWMQVKGPIAVLTNGTLVVGDGCVPSGAAAGGIAGAVKAEAAGTITSRVGTVMQVNADTFHSLINLAIPGY